MYRAVLFDFDYTLADSSAGIIACCSDALAEMGLPAPEPAAVRRTIGLSLAASFRELTGEEDPERARVFSECFIARADEVMVNLTTLYPSVAPVSATLRARGYALGIVSTKYSYRIAGVLERDGLADAFSVIIGGEIVQRHKPDPESLLLALQRLALPARDVLYVGDSVVDAETAARAGVDFVGVLSGVTPRDAFAAHPALALLEDLTGLPLLVDALADKESGANG